MWLFWYYPPHTSLRLFRCAQHLRALLPFATPVFAAKAITKQALCSCNSPSTFFSARSAQPKISNIRYVYAAVRASSCVCVFCARACMLKCFCACRSSCSTMWLSFFWRCSLLPSRVSRKPQRWTFSTKSLEKNTNLTWVSNPGVLLSSICLFLFLFSYVYLLEWHELIPLYYVQIQVHHQKDGCDVMSSGIQKDVFVTSKSLTCVVWVRGCVCSSLCVMELRTVNKIVRCVVCVVVCMCVVCVVWVSGCVCSSLCVMVHENGKKDRTLCGVCGRMCVQICVRVFMNGKQDRELCWVCLCSILDNIMIHLNKLY